MIYALDTNTLVHFFNGVGRVPERLLATPPSQVAVPSVVVYELDVGVAKLHPGHRRQHQLQTFLAHSRVLPFDRLAASTSAQLRVSLEATGLGIGPMDVLIAGTALAHGATLVTRNLREFRRVEGLDVVSWFD